MISILSFALLASTSLALPISFNTLTTDILALNIATNTTQTVSSTLYSYNSTTTTGCGYQSEVTDVVATLPLQFFNSTGNITTYCGKYIVVNSNITQKTVTVRVVDASASNSTMGLSGAVFASLNVSTSDLASIVNWRFATLNETEEALEGSMAAGNVAAMLGFASTVAESKATPTAVATPVATPAEKTTTTDTPAYTPAYTPKSTPVATVEAAASPSPAASKSGSSSSSSYSSGTYSGQATYYTQNGVAGACGKVNPDSAYIVAIDSAMWDNGSNCGRTVKITTSSGSSVTATVADECPTCASAGSLDLSQSLFESLGSLSSGVLPISWSFTS